MPAQKDKKIPNGIIQEKEPININVRVPRSTYDRIIACKKAEGFLSEQEVMRIATNEFLKRGGY